MSKQLKKDSTNLSKEDIERMELLQKANEKVGRQLTISGDDGGLVVIDELKQLAGASFDNPEEKYNIYYRGIRKLLMEYLPKGEDAKVMREIIYDEKNIFLNAGKKKSDNNGIRKSDGRMTYQPVMNEMLEIVIEWVSGSRNPFALYKQLYELNERHQYGHERYDSSTAAVANAMSKLGEA